MIMILLVTQEKFPAVKKGSEQEFPRDVLEEQVAGMIWHGVHKEATMKVSASGQLRKRRNSRYRYIEICVHSIESEV